MRYLKRIGIVALFSVALANGSLFALGGNGSGRGGGNSILLSLIVWGVVIIAVWALVYYNYLKRERNKRKRTDINAYWDHNRMVEHVRFVFRQMQNARMNRDIDLASEIVTPDLYEKYEAQFFSMMSKGEKEVISAISIHEVRIEGCDNDFDQTKEHFSAVITGEVIIYIINEKMRQIVSNPERHFSSFIVTYHFVRQSDKWLLDGATHHVEAITAEAAKVLARS